MNDSKVTKTFKNLDDSIFVHKKNRGESEVFDEIDLDDPDLEKKEKEQARVDESSDTPSDENNFEEEEKNNNELKLGDL